ncbi:TD and POZ domain-containing protein 3-like isoform X2 [Drosophila takahashii]|uniref:TD and POZ domain-containing protein 3-like isoform X2 n=1 Tax=Drosophila takahashii TaxID=29030 RepID=UPI00389937CA
METWPVTSYKKLLEGDFSDCCVIVGTRRFLCHKVILGAASEFFKRTFQPGFAEAKTGEVTLTGVTEDTFEKFRLYVYTYDRTSLNDYSNQDIIKLKECASMWMVKPLELVCEDIFQKRYPTMIYSDLLLYFEHAHHVHNMELIEKCRFEMVEKYVTIHGFKLNQNQRDLNKCEGHGLVNQMEKNPGELSNSIGVKNPNISDSNSVSLDSQKITSGYIMTILNLIDFTMNANEFFDGPGESKLISFEDKYNIIRKICKGTKKQNGYDQKRKRY